jgi:hypothetical protein
MPIRVLKSSLETCFIKVLLFLLPPNNFFAFLYSSLYFFVPLSLSVANDLLESISLIGTTNLKLKLIIKVIIRKEQNVQERVI